MLLLTADDPPPPRKEDVLFCGNKEDWIYNACINVRHDGDSIAYINGYLYAARQLVNEVIISQTAQDYLIYPIVFLYRHHIELLFKKLLFQAQNVVKLNFSRKEMDRLKTHDLGILWETLKPIIVVVCEAAGWDKPSKEDLAGVDSYIGQLVALDPGSYNFRYTHSKKGEPSFPPALKHINIRHFSETIERLVVWVDCIALGFSCLEERNQAIPEDG